MRPRAAAPAVRSAALIAAFILGLTAAPPAFSAAAFTLSSAAFENGARIPNVHTCAGADRSPPLRWTGTPAATRSYVLLVSDQDAPGGNFVHWLVYDLPAAWKGLPSVVVPILRIGAQRGGRDSVIELHGIGFGGPCPPPWPVELYSLTI